MSAPRFTAEQRAAIEDRSGSALLAANAGSGKTAVMVERFVEAVLRDEVAVGSILALTFTEKAAGELRERVRKRLYDLGEDEHARAVDAAWIGTIHGFCARVLRARPLAAGLDPRFTVLEEAATGRIASAAYERALEAWVAALGRPAVDLAAAYGQGLGDLVLGALDTLRSRGAEPRLTIPAERPAPSGAALSDARAVAAAELAGAGDGIRVSEGRSALAACERALAGGGVPTPGELDPAKLGAGAKALATEACEAYRLAWDAYRRACADHHARPALILLDELLRRYAAEYAAGKADRAAVDFEDLELGVRDLLADDAERRRWSERFTLLMVDEFQDTNRLQLDLLEALERGNLFAVGDEFQSIYRFRHADVEIFRERRAKLDAARVRGLRANFRSAPELLDVLDAAFAPVFGDAFQPLVAGRPREAAPAAADDGELRLFDPDPPADAPPVELLVTDTKGWDELAGELGLGALAEQPWRRAEARWVAHRLREEVRAGRRPGDVVVLVRATASLRLFEQALEEQGLPTYVVGGRGYWSQEQVRDGLAYLAALANPRDETAFYGVLASPFCGAGSDALVLLAAAGRDGARGPWAALREAEAGASACLDAVPPDDRDRLLRFARFFAGERARAERLPPEALLERAITATGYDLAILARAGGERRLANLRKLMRLAREYEQTEGRDLRGFLDFAVTQDLAEAREGEAALESDGLDAVRLMTIHRAKGLEFPVVCVADLGRLGAAGRPRLLIGHDGTAGLRLAPLGGGDAVPALAYERLASEEDRADAEEERRLLYVAMTRARETLILSGGTDTGRWPEPRPGGAPLDWIVRAIAGEPRELFAGAEERVLERAWEGRAARVRCALSSPRGARPGAAPRRAGARRRAAAGRAADRAPEGAEGHARAARARAAGAAAALLHRAAGLCALRLPLLPPARARPARRAAASAARGAGGGAHRPRPARARRARPRAAGGDRLRAPRAARRRGRRRAVRAPRGRRHGRGRRGPARDRRRVRPLAAERAARRRDRRAPRGRLRVLARAGRRRLARQRLRRRDRHRARRRPPDRRLQDRPPRRRRPGRAARPRLRHPADRLRAGRAARRRPARRRRLLLPRAPRRARRARLRPPPTRTRSPSRSSRSPAACSTSATRSPSARTATSAPTARAAARSAPTPRSARSRRPERRVASSWTRGSGSTRPRPGRPVRGEPRGHS